MFPHDTHTPIAERVARAFGVGVLLAIVGGFVLGRAGAGPGAYAGLAAGIAALCLGGAFLDQAWTHSAPDRREERGRKAGLDVSKPSGTTRLVQDSGQLWVEQDVGHVGRQAGGLVGGIAMPGREWDAHALLSLGRSSEEQRRYEQAIGFYDQAIDIFGDDREPAVRAKAAEAFLDKAAALGELERFEDAIAAYDEVCRRYGHDSTAALREQVAMALFDKALTLGRLGRVSDEIASLNDLVARFRSALEPRVRALVELARQVARSPERPDFSPGVLERRIRDARRARPS